jgi:ankyrin repeat protein
LAPIKQRGFGVEGLIVRKSLWILLAAASLSAPAAAQYVSDAEPFIEAVTKRDGDKVYDLLDKRPLIVNSRNGKGETALNIAIARSDDSWTRFLLGRKANPNLQDGKGDTPLITAARVGYADAVELLLSMGAKVDMTNRMGETPLIVAVQQRELAVVKLLLTNGANPDKADSAAGYSARDYAKRDARARDILAAIEASKTAKPTTKPADVKLDDFKLK